MSDTIRTQRGLILSAAIISAIVASFAAYAVLFMAVTQARQGTFFRDREAGRHLAEAAIVIAREKLWSEDTVLYPPTCVPGTTATTTELVDTNMDGVGDVAVVVTVENCGPGRTHVLSASVPY